MNAKWYTFTQNNSGGSFEHEADEGIGYAVIVEAYGADHANERAGRIGLYFNGCADGRDCPCCGDRWYAVREGDGSEFPRIYGDAVRPVKEGEKPLMGWGIPSYMHKIGGEFFAVVKEDA